jgi:hypothetical protein
MRDVAFIHDSTSIRSVLKLHPSGRNMASVLVGVDESFKLSSVDDDKDIEECAEQVADNQVGIQETRK